MTASIHSVGRLVITLLLLCLLCERLLSQVPMVPYPLSFRAERLRVIFDSLLKVTRHQAVLGLIDLPGDVRVDFSTGRQPLGKALAVLFADQPMQAVVEGGRVAVQPKPVRSFTLQVRDEGGVGLGGVTILDPQEGRSYTTDAGGRWTGFSWRPALKLQLTHVNCVSEAVTLRDHYTVTLRSKDSAESTIEKIGYGEGTVRWLTSGITKVRLDMVGMRDQSIVDVLRTAVGVLVRNTTNVPWGGSSIELRGSATVQPFGPGRRIDEPLILIDEQPCLSCQGYMSQLTSATGDPQGLGSGLAALSFLHVQDIESITVLKDGLATAIYGARGAHGVILIARKAPKAGPAVFNGYLKQGMVTAYRLPAVLSTADYLAMRRGAYAQDGQGYDRLVAPDLYWDATRDARWPRWLYKGTGWSSTALVRGTGGSRRWRWLGSVNYQRETYVYPTEASDRWLRGHGAVTYTPAGERLAVHLQGSLSLQENRSPAWDLSRLVYLYPHLPAEALVAGKPVWTMDSLRFLNPSGMLENAYRAQSRHVWGGVRVKYQWLAAVTLLANVGFTRHFLRELTVFPLAGGPRGSGQQGQLWWAGRAVQTWMAEPQARWRGSLLRVPAQGMMGFQVQETQLRSGLLERSGYTDDGVLYRDAVWHTPAYADPVGVYRLQSFFGRLQLMPGSFLLEAAGRADGSSLLPPGRRWGYFGAAGLAWIVSSTGWARKRLPWLRFGKVHLNYGLTGSDPLAATAFVRPSNQGVAPGGTYPGLVRHYTAARDARWQRTAKAEAGLAVFAQRGWRLQAVYFDHRHFNQLLAYPVAGQTGHASELRNARLVIANSGLELMAGYKQDSGKVRLEVSVSYTRPLNRLRSVDELLVAQGLLLNHSLSSRRLYRATGVDPATGLYGVADLDGNGQLTGTDRQVVRDLEIRGYGGLQGRLEIGAHWAVGFYLEGRRQPGYSAAHYAYLSTYPGQLDVYSGLSNQPAGVQDRWRGGGVGGSFQRLSTRAGAAEQQALQRQQDSDGFLTDQSYVQLRNLVIEYRLGAAAAGKWGLRGLQVFLQGENLFLLSGYRNGNPVLLQPYSQPLTRCVSTGLRIQL